MKNTRMKDVGLPRQQREDYCGRKDIGIGPVHCPVCGLFFDDLATRHIAEYYKCEQHKGMRGHTL